MDSLCLEPAVSQICDSEVKHGINSKAWREENPLLLSQKRAVTPFSDIYKASTSSQIGAGK